jgi:hypothetical protein
MRNEREILRIIDMLDESSKNRIVSKIKFYKHECGCKLGGIFAVSAVIICILYSVIFLNPTAVFAIVKLITWSAMIIIAAGLFGKVIGIGVARIKLMILYREVLSVHHKNTQYGNM